MYDSVNNARNLIPSLFNDPILSLDSSKDGRWLLGMTKTYLILLPTAMGEQSAYKTTFLKTKKPHPNILKIDPAQVKHYQMNEVSFSSAKFDDKQKESEEYVVGATGRFLVFWSLKNVAKGKLFSTGIKPLEDTVVKNEFKFNNDNVVTVLPNRIMVEKTTKKK